MSDSYVTCEAVVTDIGQQNVVVLALDGPKKDHLVGIGNHVPGAPPNLHRDKIVKIQIHPHRDPRWAD